MNCQSSVPGVGLENAYRSNLLWSIFEKNYKRKKKIQGSFKDLQEKSVAQKLKNDKKCQYPIG